MVRSSRDEDEIRISALDRMVSVLMAQIEPAKQRPLTEDQKALELAPMTLATLHNTRRTLLARIKRTARNVG